MFNPYNILNRLNPRNTPKWFKTIAFIAMVVALACASVVYGFDAGELHISDKVYNNLKICLYVSGAIAAVSMTAKDKE